MIGALAALLLWTAPAVPPQEPPPPAAHIAADDALLAAFDPLVGQIWRGASITDPGVIDEITFERTAGGRAIRSVHTVNGGVYAGDTLITFDRSSGQLISFYATNGGFYTTGHIRVLGPGQFEFLQVVHGLDSVTEVRAQTTLTDGVYRIRSQHLINGEWVETGGFDYRPIP
jgi:hypothetical protein